MKNMMIKTTTIMLLIVGFNCSVYAKENFDDESYDSIQEYGCKVCGNCLAADEDKRIWEIYEKRYETKKYEQCLEKPDGETVYGSDYRISECTWEEIERQEVLLNQKYKKLMSNLPKNQKIALRNYQRKWIKKRKEVSDCYGSASGGGTMDLVNGSSAYLFETTQRILEFDQCLSAKKISRNSKGCEHLYPLK